jgi:hypothetical protein
MGYGKNEEEEISKVAEVWGAPREEIQVLSKTWELQEQLFMPM